MFQDSQKSTLHNMDGFSDAVTFNPLNVLSSGESTVEVLWRCLCGDKGSASVHTLRGTQPLPSPLGR